MRLSVVVTIVDGGAVLERCLAALAAQHGAGDLDVIVPWDATVTGIDELARRYPRVRFAALGVVPTTHPPETPAGQHELFDRRRSAGLTAAVGDVIAILEDRGAPWPDWGRRMLDAHARLPHGVIGGAVANACDEPCAWAVYFCDFGRYQPPFEAGARAYVTDVNVGYKRRVLDQSRPVWESRYHETTVHWSLRRAGETLFLTPEIGVDQQRCGLRLRPLLVERFVWGRLFGYTRVRDGGALRRMVWTAVSPVLPIVLFARLVRSQITRPTLGRFVRVSPIVVLCLVAWSAGEAAAYVSRRG